MLGHVWLPAVRSPPLATALVGSDVTLLAGAASDGSSMARPTYRHVPTRPHTPPHAPTRPTRTQGLYSTSHPGRTTCCQPQLFRHCSQTTRYVSAPPPGFCGVPQSHLPHTIRCRIRRGSGTRATHASVVVTLHVARCRDTTKSGFSGSACTDGRWPPSTWCGALARYTG